MGTPAATGAGIEGTAAVYETSVARNNGIVTTSIMIDLTGLNSGGTAGDIIGKNGSGVAYIGRVVTADNGTVFGVRMTCYETPAGGDTDIDLYSATEGTGVEDVAISTLTETRFSILAHFRPVSRFLAPISLQTSTSTSLVRALRTRLTPQADC
jgi:hypothetical protein